MPRGIITHGELRTTLDGADLNAIYAEYVTSLNLINASREALTGLLTFHTTRSAVPVLLDGSSADFEVASQFGISKTLQADMPSMLMGVPIEWYDGRVVYTEKFLRDATRPDIDVHHQAALEAYERLEFNNTLAALMTKTTISDRPKNTDGVSIYSLYDGETDSKPPTHAGKTFAAGHQHYITTGSTNLDGADLAVMIRHITEHGYGIGENQKIVILVHPNQGDVIRGFRAGVNSSPFDFIPSEQAPAYLSSEKIIGNLAPSKIGTLDVIGSFGSALIVETYNIPAGYLIAAAVNGGARSALAIREHVRPEYRGLRIVPGDEHRPLIGSHYSSGFGVGVLNRGAACVMQVTASSTYTNPSL